MTSNMLGQCKLARQKLETIKAEGDKADPNVVSGLERKVAFLSEYEALPLRDQRKEAMLQAWSQDKTLKSWAEMHHTLQQGQGHQVQGSHELRHQATSARNVPIV